MSFRSQSKSEIETVGRIDAVPTILDVVCRSTGMGFAAISRVTENSWTACAVRDEINFGLRVGGELDVRTTICDEIRVSSRPVIISDVATNARYSQHPTPSMYGFQSYISVPIFRSDGSFFGTLCAIDPKPAQLDRPEIAGMFRLFADLIGYHLDAADRLAASEKQLAQQQNTANLRDQFIAVLGHDLRNPLASIDAGVRQLGRVELDERSKTVVALVHDSVRRMAELIDNVLDFARGRLGGGLALAAGSEKPLGPVLQQIIAESQAAWPNRKIVADIDLPEPVHCDASRIAQLLSNLMANALSHGSAEAPVRVSASCDARHFELAVANQGRPIPPEILEHLFEPFYRATAAPSKQGLGLGLYICAEIARAHGGSLTVKSDPAETRFSFRMPLTAPTL